MQSNFDKAEWPTYSIPMHEMDVDDLLRRAMAGDTKAEVLVRLATKKWAVTYHVWHRWWNEEIDAPTAVGLIGKLI